LKKSSAKTCSNSPPFYVTIRIKHRALSREEQWARYIEEEPEIYEKEELKQLLAACDEEERLGTSSS
jgi:hypothetical protein